ncbi:helix-turn-helix domain-containing protein [Streptomyces mirabilis]|uniref:helix-turn-helix domain-containing protein n=1 Tax=Streptomyces mirabilis TaxID=68239 RepID=UPI00369D34B4
MTNVIDSIDHPYWSHLGNAVREARTGQRLSQQHVAGSVGLSVRDLAALESGFIPPEAADTLGRIRLAAFDDVLGWEKGTARKHVTEAVSAAVRPEMITVRVTMAGDRSTYSQAAWVRLGKAVQAARAALRMTKPVLAYAVQSTSKTMLRLEEGRVFGDPRTAPPGDYNSEKYWFKRLALLELALEWDEGMARQILDNTATK